MSWENVTFKLSHGVNIITGISDKGKSAIIMAEELVRTNRPLGFEFASDWIKKQNKKGDWVLVGTCEATLGLSNGIEISKVIGKDTNEYRISTLSEPLKALNKEVPQEVTDLLNLSDINIQTQEDPYFLFNLTPPEIGRRLNQVASLSDIDLAFTSADKAIRAINSSIKQSKVLLKQNKSDLDNLGWVDKADKDLKQVELISSKLSIVRNDEHRLRTAKTKIEKFQEQISQLAYLDSAEQDIEKIEVLLKQFDSGKDECGKLIDLEGKIIDYTRKLDEIKIVLKFEKQVKSLLELELKVKKLSKEYNNLIDLENKIKDLQNNYNKSVEEYESANELYEKSKPDVCPLCNGTGRV